VAAGEKNATVNSERPMGRWKRELAHRIIDAGAHVYIAHGDPRLQGIEIWKGCPIFFCTGNFIFQTKTELKFYGAEVWQSVLVHLHCHDISETTSYSVKLTPIQLNEEGATPDTHLQTRGLPSLASRQAGQAILHKLAVLSAEFGTQILVEDSIEGDPSSPVIGWVHGAGSYDPSAVAAAKAALLNFGRTNSIPGGPEQRHLQHIITDHAGVSGGGSSVLRANEAEARARAAAAHAAAVATAASSQAFFASQPIDPDTGLPTDEQLLPPSLPLLHLPAPALSPLDIEPRA